MARKTPTKRRGGRVTPRAQESSGRYTPPIPREQKVSPTWVPALIIGMDLIGGLDTFLIDYQRGEVQIRVRELFHDPFNIKKGGASAGAAPDVSSDFRYVYLNE